jgi:hypothetical protein
LHVQTARDCRCKRISFLLPLLPLPLPPLLLLLRLLLLNGFVWECW